MMTADLLLQFNLSHPIFNQMIRLSVETHWRRLGGGDLDCFVRLQTNPCAPLLSEYRWMIINLYFIFVRLPPENISPYKTLLFDFMLMSISHTICTLYHMYSVLMYITNENDYAWNYDGRGRYNNNKNIV